MKKAPFRLILNYMMLIQGEHYTPVTSMTWWVGQPRNDTPILEKQTVATPSNDVTIIIPPEANICTSGRDEERFVIVRIATASHVKHKIFEYIINNLGLVPYPEE